MWDVHVHKKPSRNCLFNIAENNILLFFLFALKTMHDIFVADAAQRRMASSPYFIEGTAAIASKVLPTFADK